MAFVFVFGNTLACLEAAESVIDCTKVQLKSAGKNLTKDEKLVLLNNTFFDSVNQYSECINNAQQSGSDGLHDNGNGSNSESLEESESESIEQEEGSEENQKTEPTVPEQPILSSSSGKKNTIIAPKDNDLAVCNILWDAVLAEKDSKAKTKLEKQYKNYNCG